MRPFRFPPLRGLLPLLLAAAAPAVSAQSTLQLYGLADGGLTYTTGQDAAKLRLSSGIMEGSRWGLKGSEDLGGGWKVLFVLESRFELDSGDLANRPATGGRLPDRFSQPDTLGAPPFTQTVFNSVLNNVGLPLGSLLPLGPLFNLSPQVSDPLGLRQQVADAVVEEAGRRVGVNHLERNLFDRQAYVALVTPVGGFVLGRQYSPAYEVFYQFDAMKTESGLSAGQIAAIPQGIEIRTPNALQYRIALKGYTASLMYGTREGGTSTPSIVPAGRFLGANAYYKDPDGRYGYGTAYATRKNSKGKKGLTNWLAGAFVRLGPGTLHGLFTSIRDDNPQSGVDIREGLEANSTLANPLLAGFRDAYATAYNEAFKQDARLFHLGYSLPFGRHTVTVAYNLLDDRSMFRSDLRSYGLAYTYAFSKRTDLNAVLVHFDNRGLAQLAPGGNGYLGGVTRAAGVDATQLALGLRHRF